MARGAKSEGPQAPVPDKLCRTHLERVASSATFARAEQLRTLLRWLGDRSLSPAAMPPTEKEIGEMVLRRRDFDPQADSLVRKEMSRLRVKLTQYYQREGARERVRIRHLSGYVLGFAWADQLGAKSPAESGLPCLLVLPLRSHPDLGPQSMRLAEEVLVQVGEVNGATLVSPTTALSYAGRIGNVREFAAECGADFVLEGTLELRDTQLRVTLWLVDGRSGTTEKVGRFAAPDTDELARRAALWLQEEMARHLAD
jgi:TolB-like protein